jgi:hypothetical protein
VRETPSEREGKALGALLITQGVLFAILRFLTLVYVVASEAYNADRFRTPLPDFVPWIVVTVVVSFVLIWGGSFYRRSPAGAWGEVGAGAQMDLVAAGLVNLIAIYAAVAGLVRSPSSTEAAITWIALALISSLVVAGIVHDVARSRARPDRAAG